MKAIAKCRDEYIKISFPKTLEHIGKRFSGNFPEKYRKLANFVEKSRIAFISGLFHPSQNRTFPIFHFLDKYTHKKVIIQ
jgi:hypothetical protein